MKVGGISTRWMFADLMKEGQRYFVRVSGSGVKKAEQKGGKDVPYVVCFGTLEDGVPCEYQIAAWRVQSKEAFDPDKGGDYVVRKVGNNVFFEPAEITS